jgi:hypothetical protein
MILSGIIKNKDKKISITINPIFGYPKIYLDDCKKFPFCNYKDDNDLINLEEISSNKLHDYSNFFRTKENITILNSYQPLLLLHCTFINDCFFGMTIFTEDDPIILKEEELLINQYLLKREKNKYIINYGNYRNIKQIIIDLIIFNGKIHIDLKYKEKYIILNKYVYIIDVNSDNQDISENKTLNFTISGVNDSLYSIKYKFIRNNKEDNNMEVLYNKVNNFELLDVDKNISLIFLKYLNPNLPIHSIINIYSPNCQFKLFKNNETAYVNLFNNFYQENSNSPTTYYEIELYNSYPLNYRKNKCILYINNILDFFK